MQTCDAFLKRIMGKGSHQVWKQMHLCGSGAVAELENKLKKHYGMRYALCVSNATTGLFAIALALELRDCEFVTTPYTYGASLAGWLLLQNRPIFADIDAQTLTLDVDSVRRTISGRTKALLAVDIFGTPSDTVSLRKLADEHGIWYIADAAQSLGASRRRMPASCMADALVVSFTAGKTVFAGEGGAVVTDNSALYEKLVWHTQHPLRQRRDLGLQLSNEFSLNGRIHPLAAVWANAEFRNSLRRSRNHRNRCLAITDAMNSIGLTQSIAFREQGIEPTFFRLTASWRNRPNTSVLLNELQSRGFHLDVTHSPVKVIYRQAAFVAAFEPLVQSKHNCPEAIRQESARFCLVRNHSQEVLPEHGRRTL